MTILLFVMLVIASGLDLYTTIAVRNLGGTETNPLLRDENNKFVLWKGIVFKLTAIGLAGAFALFAPATPAMALLGVSIGLSTFAAVHNLKIVVR
jgi:hypothetical protein